MMIKVAIVDDQLGNRNILSNKLKRDEQFSIVLMAENGRDFMEKMQQCPTEQFPDVVLMDLEMPVMDGVDAIALGTSFYPRVKFVVLTIFDDEDRIFKAIKAGAYGYLLKDESGENIAEMLVNMTEYGAGPVSPGIAYKMLQLVQNSEMKPKKNDQSPVMQNHFFSLTDREKEILHLLVEGLLYKEIGARLGIAPNTAKKHVINIYQKLHVNSRAQAMHLAYEKGLL
ncbi:MAG: response regulator transcription factor [Chitinophagaceae bacterium]|nr:MAG: response regulator transcription factor [Chitinophagaceae bacterium]